jgi:hypothetical protein
MNMGEAKRRKKLDPNYGKLKLPTSVPIDYLKYDEFLPCFGYVYLVQFKDVEPCSFVVNKKLVLRPGNNTFNFCHSQGLVTIEMASDMISTFEQKYNNNAKYIGFVAKPNFRKRYKDSLGLMVCPFNVDYFFDCDKFDHSEQNNIKRHYFISD